MTLRMIWMVICVTGAFDANAQKIGKTQQPMLTATEVQIYNGSKEEMWFTLCAKRDGACKDFSLESGEDKTYKKAKFIRISTAGKSTLKYQLKNKERYKLAWDKEKRQWNVFHMVAQK